MSPDNWRRVDRLYAEILQRPAGEWEQFLNVACAKDFPEVRAKVEELLRLEDDGSLIDGLGSWVNAALQREPATIEYLEAGLDDRPTRPGRGIPAPAGYEILYELGRGGMGVVYLAQQVRAGRLVALKFPLKEKLDSLPDGLCQALLCRFRREAEIMAGVQHAHVVQVFEVGEYQGLPFYSMELCQGGNLKEKLAGTPLPPGESAALVKKLAQGVQATHEKGAIHCDLCQANVILANDGTPKITDFGIAKKADDPGLTLTGDIMGHAPYMAPEQASGNRKDVKPATDVYALGAILYECLTGRPPFKAATSAETIQQVLTQDPVPPRQLNGSIARGLQFICLKCLEKEPAYRYQTAEELAADLSRYLDGIDPDPLPWWEWLWRRIQSGGSFDHEMAVRWSRLSFLEAGCSLLGHALMFWLLQMGSSAFVYWTWFLCFQGASWLISLRNLDLRERRLDPTERGLLLNWAAAVIADTLLFALFCPPFGVPRPETVVGVYPAWFTVHGLMWVMEARQYWGRFYVLGAVFFLTAALMPLRLDLAPLVLGVVNGAGLVWLALGLRRIARRAEMTLKQG